MNVFIDTERLRNFNSGLGHFCLHLGKELVRQKPSMAHLTFLVPSGQASVFGSDVSYRPAAWWRKLWNPGSFDLWHCMHQDSPYLPVGKTRLILTIHDLNFLEREDYSKSEKARKLAILQRKVDRAAAIVTISNYTASIVRQQLRLAEELPLKVIYNGTSLLQADTVITPALGIEGSFFLFVGIIHPKKNIHTLLPLLEAFPDWQLVLAGSDEHPYATYLREQAGKMGVIDRFRMLGIVDEETKRWLYDHCGAFLFPSLMEGFGLPVVEAMSCGKPVFLSRLTSLPEIGGKDAYYFDSFEPEEMAEIVFQGLSDFQANPFRVDRLQKWAAQFSWEYAGEQYWRLYQKLLG